MTAPALGQLLGFDHDELVLNRAGRLSARQAEALRAASRSGSKYLILMVLFLVAFVAVALAVVVPKATKHTGSSVNPTPIVVGVLVFCGLIAGLSMVRTRRRLRRLASGAVLTVSGPARTKARRMGGNVNLDSGGGSYGGGMRYELSIAAVTFFVRGPDVLAAFDGGGTFRAYYAAGGGHAVMNRLLSIEPIG